MTRQIVLDALAAFLAGDDGPPTRDEDLFESGRLDSFKLIALVLHLEENFSVRLSDAAVTGENFRTLGRIAQLVEMAETVG